jgi:tRNA-Thr(GGU) m(6)t(6)A37 methyltransferase TsaA
MQITIESIGSVVAAQGFAVKLNPSWRRGLLGLEGFGHVMVLWQASRATWEEGFIQVPEPYRGGPAEVGIFATRSPVRPNGICVSVAAVTGVDMASGTVSLAWIDAEDGSPVIDIKPYHPSSDRVEAPLMPRWCSSWPRSIEQSASFDWSAVFNFG